MEERAGVGWELENIKTSLHLIDYGFSRESSFSGEWADCSADVAGQALFQL
jgi:hypothetical protein